MAIDAARMARRVDPNAIHGVLELFRSADPTRRRLWDAMERRLLETLEELRNTSSYFAARGLRAGEFLATFTIAGLDDT